MDISSIKIDRESHLPFYRQLAEKIKEAVQEGKLTEGTRLPPIRSLAAALKISPVTITQSYETLALEGIAGGQVGRGTFILRQAPRQYPNTNLQAPISPPVPPEPVFGSSGWQTEITTHLKPTRVSEINRLLQASLARWSGPPEDFISLTSGSPAAELFPIAPFRQAMERAGGSLEHDNRALFQYGLPLGDFQTREWLAGYLTRFGFQPAPDDILLTSGSQQGLDLIARVFLGPGEAVLIESPTYSAALDIFEQRGISWLPVPLDDEGLEMGQLTRLVERYHPKLLYTIPTAQSPTGITLSNERRRRLVELARSYNFLIVEDDTCNEFYYNDNLPPPSIKGFDSDGHVIYLKSFSKQIFPMVRLGCVVAAPFLLEKLAEAKQVFDRATSLPLARVVQKHASSAAFERELKLMCKTYRARRDFFMDILEREIGSYGCSWTYPQAGFSLLLTLPAGVNQLDAHAAAASFGVGVLPGVVLFPVATEAPQTLRLSFCDNSEARLEEAVRRLGLALRELQGRRQKPATAPGLVSAV